MKYDLIYAKDIIGFPILSVICYLPLLGAIILLFIKSDKKIKILANVIAFIDLLVSLLLIPYFKTTPLAMQFVEKFPWIPTFGIDYFFGIDGISLLLILLTTLLTFLSILSSWSAIQSRIKEYYIFMLILSTGMLGVFMALDFILFYVFWEVMLVPMYFIIGIWGGPNKLYAAIKFFLYTLLGSVLMLIAILALYFYNYDLTGEYTFNILKFHELSLPLNYQDWIFLAFFIGFAIKVPMFPFHTWLPDAHVEAPTAGSVILAGILLKMGTYGFVRISLPICPESTIRFLPWMVSLSIIGIIYGALVAMMQKDWKKLVAYSSVSHLGFAMLGIFALNPPGLKGSVLAMVNHGVSTGALFLIVGLIYERKHTRIISEFSGLSHAMPIYAAIFAIITMASIGLPGLCGFMGEFPILQGAYLVNWRWAALAATGIVLGAAYMLWLYQRVMLGTLPTKHADVKDLNFREITTLIPLVILAFWIGLYPKPYFQAIEQPVKYIVQKVQPDYFKSQHPIVKFDKLKNE